VTTVIPWHQPATAIAYDEYARRFPLYRETARDLADLADISPCDHVVDLGCGTGVTTQAILDRLGPSGQVTAVDFSSAMLSVARGRVPGPQVSWRCGRAEHLDMVCDHPADRVTCNMAFWQFDLPATAAAIRTILARDGRLIFSDGHRIPDGCGADAARRARVWTTQLAAHGFELSHVDHREYPEESESLAAWLRIPLWTDPDDPQEMAARSTARLLASHRSFRFCASYYTCRIRQRAKAPAARG
jgi:ubiquinone/menaquinone biosynthesis C-methylase UbiE